MPDIKALGDLPYFIFAGIVSYGIVKLIASMVIQLATIWQDVSHKRNLVDTKRNEIEERSMNLIEKVSEMLKALSNRHDATQKLLAEHDKAWGDHDKQQQEIRQSITELQDTLNKLIEHSKNCPQLTDQIKLGFEELSASLAEIKELVNGNKDKQE